MAREYHQGTYTPTNREKYKGIKNPRYLSSYERHVFEWADRSPNVLEWAAETVVVPYWNPVKNRQARYIVDVWIKYRNKRGEIREDLVEIKPSAQTRAPKRGKKKKSTYEEEMMTWMVNQAKWQAAQKFAEERGWTFRLLTEKAIFR